MWTKLLLNIDADPDMREFKFRRLGGCLCHSCFNFYFFNWEHSLLTAHFSDMCSDCLT